MNVKRVRKRQELKSVLKLQKTHEKNEEEVDGDNNNNGSYENNCNKLLCEKAKRRLKIIKSKERFREMQAMARDKAVVQNRLTLKNPIGSSGIEPRSDGIDGKDFTDDALLLYGIAEGATGTIHDFDKILEAIKNDIFLSGDFNLERELRAYKLDKDGMPKYKGGGRSKIKSEDVAKAAKRFKVNAKGLGNVANTAGLIITTLESFDDGRISAVEATDILMGAIAFVPGYGWVVSGAYSLMRMTTPLNADFGIKMDNGVSRFGEWQRHDFYR